MKKTVGLLLALGFAAMGCTKTIDNTELEKKIKDDGVSKSWPVKTVSCPSGKEMKAGDKFDCTMTFEDGKTTTTSVEQSDGNGNLKWSTNDLVPTKDVADAISHSNGNVPVTCPHKVVVIAKEGDKFTCEADVKGEKHPFEVTMGKDGKFNAVPKGG